MDLAHGNVGQELQYDVRVENGNVVLTVNLSVATVLDIIKEKIPGKLDDIVIDGLKLALKAL